MDMLDMLRVLRKRTVMILLIPVLSLAVAFFMLHQVLPKIYQSSTTVLIGIGPFQEQLITYNEIRLNREMLETYGEIARSNIVTKHVIELLGLEMRPDQLREKVEVAIVANTEIIEIMAEHTDPATAALIADAVAQSFIENLVQIMKVEHVTIIDPAIPSDDPNRPKVMQTMIAVALLSLLSSVLLAFLLDLLDRRIRTAEDIERYMSYPLLGVIPRFETMQPNPGGGALNGLQQTDEE